MSIPNNLETICKNYRKELFEKFLDRIKSRFGETAVKNITEMSKIKLKRKIIEENKKN